MPDGVTIGESSGEPKAAADASEAGNVDALACALWEDLVRADSAPPVVYSGLLFSMGAREGDVECVPAVSEPVEESFAVSIDCSALALVVVLRVIDRACFSAACFD